MTPDQVADPDVSRVKFQREIEEFRSLAEDYHRRGWFLTMADFPCAFFLLGASQLKPPAIVTGVLFDYSDYDFRPPSVKLVDPFTAEPYKMKDLPVPLLRATESQPIVLQGLQLPPGMQIPRMVQQLPLMQAYGPEDVPFLCVAGVREYHDHPGHSGDAWELHRGQGAGRMVRILEIVETYGVRPLAGYNVTLVPQITGFTQKEVPH